MTNENSDTKRIAADILIAALGNNVIIAGRRGLPDQIAKAYAIIHAAVQQAGQDQ